MVPRSGSTSDLNGDGFLGLPQKVIEAAGSISLTMIGGSFYLHGSNGSGPALKYNGSEATGTAGGWMPIGAEQTASGYEVAWKDSSTGQYIVWQTDASGNYVSSNGILWANSSALQALEPEFQQDLNGVGGIGVPNHLDFGTAVSDENLWFVRSGNNLLIDIIGTTTQQTVVDWVTAGGNKALEITAGGLKLDSQIADSDDLARVFRFDLARVFRDDLAHRSDLISPGARGVLAVWFLASCKPRGQC